VNAALGQSHIADFVLFVTILRRVRPAVDLDRQVSGRTVEVEHIRTYRMLAAELETV
jgi:hypothetical protein